MCPALQAYNEYFDRQNVEAVRGLKQPALYHWVANVDGGGRYIRESGLGTLQAYVDRVVQCFGDDPAKPFHRYVMQLEEFKGHVGHLKAAIEAERAGTASAAQLERLNSVKLDAGWFGFLVQPHWLREEGSNYAHWWGVATVLSANLLGPVPYVRGIVVPTFGIQADTRPDVVFFGESERHLPAISWDLPEWAINAAKARIQADKAELRAKHVAAGADEHLAEKLAAGTAMRQEQMLTRQLAENERPHGSSGRIVSVVVDDRPAGRSAPPSSSPIDSAGTSCAASDPLTTHTAAPSPSPFPNSTADTSCEAPNPLTTFHGHLESSSAPSPTEAFSAAASPTAVWLTALYGPVRRASAYERRSFFVRKMEDRELMWELTGIRYLAPLKDTHASISLGGDYNLEIVIDAERQAAGREWGFHQAGTLEGFWDAATSYRGGWLNLIAGEGEYTRVGRSSSSRLDYILITKPLKSRMLGGGTARLMNLASDHSPVFAAYLFPTPSASN
jgi:hypothetical protein